jgi:hypothetical protein
MYALIAVGAYAGLLHVAKINNTTLRASIGIPLVVAMFFSGLMALTQGIAAQWIPDRSDYTLVSKGNFYTTAPDMATALSIALPTLQYNGAKMHTLDIDKSDIDAPLFNYFIRESDMVYVVYITRTRSNGYVVWFKFLPNESTDFEEDFIILEYVK